MSADIPGMPRCGTCKQCNGALHFATEMANGMLCGGCGPGGINFRGVNQLFGGGRQQRLPDHVRPNNPQPQQMQPPPTVQMQQAPPAPFPTNGGQNTVEVKNNDVSQIAATLAARGFDPNACQFCLLKDMNMNVASSTVPHKDGCPRISETE